MAEKTANKGQFKPGQPGGPGRKPLPAFIRDAKKLSETEFISSLQALSGLPTTEVIEIAKDDSLPIRSSIMANWLVSARTDDRSRQSLFDRIFGKVKEQVEVNLTAKLAKLSNDDLMAAGLVAVERLKTRANNEVLPDQ